MSYTAAQLVTLACQICNIPGRTAQVGQMLNIILANYAQTMDEDAIRKTTTLSIGPQATIPYFYALPTDYLRYYDVFYLVNGEPFYLEQMELKDLDRQYAGSGVSQYPEMFATDISQVAQATAGTSPSIAFYPPPSIPLTVTVRYRPQTADITTPESSATVPWFPNQLVLLQELAEKAMWLSDDSRSETFRKNAKEDVKKYMAISDDKEGFAMTVKLDPRQFRPRSNFPPSKKTGF
jgi:hypothetical protein